MSKPGWFRWRLKPFAGCLAADNTQLPSESRRFELECGAGFQRR